VREGEAHPPTNAVAPVAFILDAGNVFAFANKKGRGGVLVPATVNASNRLHLSCPGQGQGETVLNPKRCRPHQPAYVSTGRGLLPWYLRCIARLPDHARGSRPYRAIHHTTAIIVDGARPNNKLSRTVPLPEDIHLHRQLASLVPHNSRRAGFLSHP